MKAAKIGILVLVLAVLTWLALYYRKAMRFYNSYSYRYKVTSVNSNGLKNLLNIASGAGIVTANFTIWLTNKVDFAVTITDLQLSFYHDGQYIGNTPVFTPIVIKPASESEFNGSARFNINKALLQTAMAVRNKTVRVDYEAKFKLNGLPFNLSYNGFYNVNVLDYL